MFPGIADRMQKELTSLSPSSMKVRCSDGGLNSVVLFPFVGQDRRTARAEILGLDWWFYPRLP